MLHFFRKIKQQLFQESNLKRYLLYAAGEILLVVIGILIALKVNNWNNDQNDRRTGQIYLIELRQDAMNDLGRLDNYLKSAESYILRTDSIYRQKLNAGFSEEVTIEDLNRIGTIRQTFFIKDETYQEIISNGHLSFLPREVKETLMDLHNQFKAVNKIDDQAATMINNHHLKMGNYYELIRQTQTNNYHFILSDRSNEDKALLTYKNYINVCYDWMKTQTYFYGRLKEQYTAFLKKIDESSQ